MVNIVRSSFVSSYGYRETNLQLAKENSELRQAIHQRDVYIAELTGDNAQLKEEVVELRHKLENWIADSRKYNAIVDIVLSKETPLSITGPREQSTALPLPAPPSIRNNDSTQTAEECEDNQGSQGLDRISECSEEEQCSQQAPLRDSLEPPDVTSVPTLLPERVVNTPSIFHCLDATEAHISVSNGSNFNSPIRPVNRNVGDKYDMFQSTPVQRPKATPPSALEAVENVENQPNEPKHKRAKTTKPKIQSESPPKKRYNLRKRG